MTTYLQERDKLEAELREVREENADFCESLLELRAENALLEAELQEKHKRIRKLATRLHEVLKRERIWNEKNKARITELEAELNEKQVYCVWSDKENDKLRERLLERNNVHLRLVKMRSALEESRARAMAAGGGTGWGPLAEIADIARKALEEDRGPLSREEYMEEMEG